jgi:O26-antigen biosynthesis N-acetyl-L-fucosamine transferase
MKILYLVDSYYPEIRSATRLARDLTREWVAQGNTVTLLTPTPDLKPPMSEEMDGVVRVVRVRSARTKGVNRLTRALAEIRLPAIIWRNAGEYLAAHRHDLIVSYSPTIFFGPLVRRLKRLWGVPSYLILRDIFPLWAADAGVISRRNPIYHYFEHMARVQYATADTIGVQSSGDLRYFADTSYPREVLYNWFSPEPPMPDGVDRRATYGVGNRFVFFYGGNIGVAQNLDLVLRLAADLADDPRAYFLLVGEGSETARLGALIRQRGLGNISIRPPVPELEYFRLLAEMDVGLLSLDPRLTNNNFPAKLLGYLSLGKPVLAALNAGHELFELLGSAGAGLCAAAEDYPRLLAHARTLLADPVAARRMGENGRRLAAERFSAPAAARQITSHFVAAQP